MQYYKLTGNNERRQKGTISPQYFYLYPYGPDWHVKLYFSWYGRIY